VLIEAMRGLDAQLRIIGTGAEAAALARRIAAAGLGDRVALTGFLPQPAVKHLLHAARVFAFPSVTAAEAFGIAQLEAMACGLPVVNTALPTAVPEVARDGREGRCVPPGDPVALRAVLRRLLDTPEEAARLGAAAQRRAEAAYGLDRFLGAVAAVYRAAAARRAA
jgi:rhamnosyl/mannosyltransferase